MKSPFTQIVNSVMTISFIVLVGFFALSTVIQKDELDEVQTVCIAEYTDTEERIFTISSDLDTIGFTIDSIIAKLDSLELER